MEKITISNMPLDTAYEFGEGIYVFKTMLTATRSGNYEGAEHLYTEVYYKDGQGRMQRDWSGGLVTNPYVFDPETGLDKRGCFTIFSYDMDCNKTYRQEKELSLASPEDQLQINGEEPSHTRHR